MKMKRSRWKMWPLRRLPRHLRAVSRIEGWLSLDEAELLYNLAVQADRGCIIEIGSYRGRSTVALGLGVMDGHRVPVYAFDPHEEHVGVLGGVFGPEDRAAFFRTMLRTGCYKVVRLVNLPSDIVAAGWQQPVSMLWIDGDHSYEGVKRDYLSWERHLADGAYIAFDDSIDPALGPSQFIAELVPQAGLSKVTSVGKVTVFRKEK